MADIDSKITLTYHGPGICDPNPCNSTLQQRRDNTYVFSAKTVVPTAAEQYTLRVDDLTGAAVIYNHYPLSNCSIGERCDFEVQLPDAGDYRWQIWAEDAAGQILVLTEKCDFTITDTPAISCPEYPESVGIYGRNCDKISALFPGINVDSISAPDSDAVLTWEFSGGDDDPYLCYTGQSLGEYNGTITLVSNGETYECAVEISVTDLPDMLCADDCLTTSWDTSAKLDPRGNDTLPFSATYEPILDSATGPGQWSADGDKIVWTPDNTAPEQITTATVIYRAYRQISAVDAEDSCIGKVTVVILPPTGFDLCHYTGCDITIEVAVCGSQDWHPVGTLTSADLQRRWSTRQVRKLNIGKRGKCTRRSCTSEWTASLDGDYCASDTGQAIAAHSPQVNFRMYTDTPETGIVWQGSATVTQISTPINPGTENGTFSMSLEGCRDLTIKRGW